MRAPQTQVALLVVSIGLGGALTGPAHAEKPAFEVYGFAQADFIQDFKRVDSNWDDTLRPSRIPTTDGAFGSDGQSLISVKQSRFGMRYEKQLGGNDFVVNFDFDLYGKGDHEGETTFNLRHAYGSWGPILAGQTETVFMDLDNFPNVIDYWGPPGMVFVRTPQIRFTYKTGGHTVVGAIEKPSNDIDPGNIRVVDPALGSGIDGDEKLPDFTTHYRYDGDWGHVQLAGILRRVGFETPGAPGNEPQGSRLGWGVNLTSNIKTWNKDVLHLGTVYGEGIATYMNDGGVDLAPEIDSISPTLRLSPKAQPLLGLMIYYDHYWSETLSSSIGWSRTKVDNTSFQEAGAFHKGEYASVNLLYTPIKQLMFGAEFLWGQREDFDGSHGDDTRLQLSIKYSFSSNDFI